MITNRMIQAYKLCHHDHKGLPVTNAAVRMGIKPKSVRDLLYKLRRQAPQLFPILTQEQAKVWHLWLDEGMTFREIAEVLNLTIGAVRKRCDRVKKKFDWRPDMAPRLKVVDPYKLEHMNVKAKF